MSKPVVNWPLIGIICALVFGILKGVPLSARLEFGGDEGYELQKAFLVNSGYTLYNEIWNDQPPILTMLLSALFELSNERLLSARLLSLLSASFVAWSVGMWAARLGAKVGGCLVVVVLFANSIFFLLSTSAMVEMPTVAAALVAVTVAGTRRVPTLRAAILAGACLGIAAQIKLTALLYAPTCISIVMLRAPHGTSIRRHLATISLLGTAFLITFCGIAWAFPGEFGQLLSHFSRQMRSAFAGEHAFEFHLRSQEAPLLLFLVLVPFSTPRDKWRAILPFWITLLTTLTALSTHRPFWDYYKLHFLVPGAVLLAVPIQSGWEAFKDLCSRAPKPGNVWPAAACLIPFFFSVLVPPTQIIQHVALAREPDSLVFRELVSQMRRFTNKGDCVFSIRPMIAFQAGVLTPPLTSIIPDKRVRMDPSLSQTIAKDFGNFHPACAYLYFFLVDPVLRDLLARDYRLVFRDGDHCMYLRSDIWKRASKRATSTAMGAVI